MSSIPVFEHRTVETNGIHIRYAVAGAGPPVVLLHGFPETGRTWAPLMRRIGDRFTLVAPDLRGFGGSDRPRDGYDIETLADDVAGLIRTLAPGGRVRVVGHDWGGAIAWVLAYRHPGLLDRVAILNAPHPYLFARAVFRTSQFLRSWYMFAFQVPGVSESLLRVRDGAFLDTLVKGGYADARRATEAHLAEIREEMSRPGVLEAALRYYRTAMRSGPRAARPYSGRTEVPVKVIWGERDRALGTALLDGLEAHAERLVVHRIPGTGHFVHREAEDEVAASLLAWLEPETPPA